MVFFISTIVAAQTVVYHENFESPSNADSVTSSSNPVGGPSWGISTALANSGTQSDTNVVTTTTTLYLTTDTFNTLGYYNVLLEFAHICKIDFNDAATIEVSTNGGSTWTMLTSTQYLGTGQFGTLGNKFSSVSYVNDWQPSTATAIPTNAWWKTELFDITTIANNASTVQVRFSLADAGSPGAGGNYGWLIDDIKVTASFSELIPPSIVMIPPIIQDTAYSSGPYQVKATITDASGIDTAFIEYWVSNGAFGTIGMSTIATDTFAGSIPFYGFGKTIHYYLKAIDNSAAQNYDSTSTYQFYCKYSSGGTFIIGTGTIQNSTTGYPCPYGQFYTGNREQYLIRASELQAVSAPGGQITSLGFDVVTPNGPTTTGVTGNNHNNYTIRLKNTTISALSSASWETGLTQVFTTTQYQTVTGWNTHTFQIPFVWDGTSNLLIEVCFDNYVSGSSYSNNAIVNSTTASFLATNNFHSDGGSVCNGSTIYSGYPVSTRPNMQLGFVTPSNLTNDIGISAITNPTGGVLAGTPFNLEVELKNFGVDTITSAEIIWELDGIVFDTMNWTGTLMPGTTISPIVLDTLTVLLGTHSLKVWSDMPNGVGDFNTGNDTSFLDFYACSALLNGAYTIGGTNPDFNNFSDAELALVQCGISGPVTFNVAAGTYNEQIELPLVSGSSSSNTITFKSASGDSSTVILTYDASPTTDNYTLLLNGTSHITFQEMTIQASDSTFAKVIELKNNAHDVTLNNNIISAQVVSGATDKTMALISTTDSVGDNINILHNSFINGSYAIDLEGSINYPNGWNINNNTIDGYYYSAIELWYANSVNVSSNDISAAATANVAEHKGIYLQENVGSPFISKNKISTSSTLKAYGIRISDSDLDSLNHGMIVNNFVQTHGSNAGSCGILVHNTNNCDLYYNSVHLIGNSTGSGALRLLDNGTIATKNLKIINNIFTNNSGGNTFLVAGVDTSKFINDYNVLYTFSGSKFADLNGTAISNLAGWRTNTGDAVHSDTIDPYFSSTTDLHTTNNLINAIGTPILGITDDIDGDLRNATTPDIGADEFDPSPYDVAVIEFLSPIGACGLDSNETVTIRIKNVGSAAVSTGLTANYQILGDTTVVTENVTTAIVGGDTLDYTFNTTVNLDVYALMADSTFEFKAWVDLSTDPVHYNDTIYATVESGYQPASPIVTDTTIAYGDSVTLTAQHIDSVFYWYPYDTSTVELYKGEFYTTPQLYDTTTYWVAVSGGLGNLDSVHPSTYSSTYTAVNGLRGYHFQAPVDFVITGLRVPTNVGTDPQSVEVLQFANAPTGSTDPHTVLFHAAMVPGSGYIPCNIPILAGDYISINGSRGVGTHNNNYAPSANISIYGVSVAVDRSWSNNAALYTNPTPSGTVTRTTGSISQVDFLYGDAGGGCESVRMPLTVNVSGIPLVDVGISAIEIPAGCGLTSNEQIKIEVYNKGIQPAYGNTLASFRIDSNSFITPETITDTLQPYDTIVYTFTTPANLLAVVNDTSFRISAYVSHTLDLFSSNDSISDTTFSNYTPPAPIVSNVLIPFATPATITAQSNDSLEWYAYDTASVPLSTNSVYTTPILYDTTTYWVQAVSGAAGGLNIIGTGTASQYYAPCYGYYDFGWSSMIFEANEIPNEGLIDSVSFYIANTVNNYTMTSQNFYMTHTSMVTHPNNNYPGTSGKTLVFSGDITWNGSGWFSIVLDTPFEYNGVDNLLFYWENYDGSYTSGYPSWQSTAAPGKTIYDYQDNTFPATTGTALSNRPNVKFWAKPTGCPSTRVPLTVNVSSPPQFDAGVKSIHQPVTDFDLTNNEAVQVMVANTGTDSIYNFQLAYEVDNLAPVIDTFTNVLLSGDSALFTFSVPANLSVYKVYDIKAYTMLAMDTTYLNDTITTQVENKMIVYCPCTATSGSYEDITNVTIANLNNTSTVPATGSMYTDFTSIPPAILTPGQTYNVSISTDFAAGNTYQYTCWVNMFIDYNRDGTFDPVTELAYGSTTTSSNTVTGTVTVPQTASTGSPTMMRVVFRESGTQANTGPCGTYTWGETEDYLAFIMPLIPNDAGVTEIISPDTIINEAVSVPVVVVVKNYGTDTITFMSIDYEVNNGTPVTNSYNGILPPGNIDTVTLASFISPAGNSNICAYTVLSGDTNTFNDNTCKSFFGIPVWDAVAVEIIDIPGGCGLTTDTVKMLITNIGVNTINGNITASYRVESLTPVTQAVTDSIPVGDTLLFTFSQLANFAVTTVDSVFDIAAWVDLTGDNVSYNDTAYNDVESLHTPADPIVTSPVSIPYASPATLTASSPTGDTLIWYDSLAGGTILGGGPSYTTPLMYVADTFYVQAGMGGGGSGTPNTITTTFQAGNSFAGNMFDITPINTITIDSFDVNIMAGAATVEVYYRMGTYVGFTGTSSGWILVGSTNVIGLGSGIPTKVNIGGLTLQANQKYGMYVTVTAGTMYYTNIPPGLALQTNADMSMEFGYGGGYPFALTNASRQWNGTIYYHKGSGSGGGCASNRIPVVVNVTGQSTSDVGVYAIPEPVTAVNLTNNEIVKVKVKNYGTTAQSNIPVSYKIDNLPPVNETIAGPLNANDTLIYTFVQTANLGIGGNYYQIKAYTGLSGDTVHLNDTTVKTVQNMLPNYCICSATSGSYEDLTNVTISNLNNTSTVPASGSMYTDFTSTVAPAQLAPGVTYPVSITSDFAVYTTQYTCWVNMFIDYNRDGVFDPVSELAFGSTTTSSNTVTGTVTVPWNANPGLTMMRVVLRESGTQANTGPCGTYTWGETEDYYVSLAPQISYDAGVIAVLQPPKIAVNPNTPIEVIVVNYGSDSLTSIPVSYELNNGTPITQNWSGVLLPGDSANVVFPSILLPTGQNNICAYTGVQGDSNTFNDQKCTQSFVLLTTPLPYSDNFEGVEYWLADTVANQWERGVPTATTINTAHSPVNVWAIKLDTNYANSSNDYLYSPRFDLTLFSPDKLKFWHYYQTEPTYDGCKLQYQNIQGNWVTLGTDNDTNATNWYNTYYGGTYSWTGTSGGWIQSTYDISAISGFGSYTMFRFVFTSNTSNNSYDGWAIDDFELTIPTLAEDAGVSNIITPTGTTTIGSQVTVEVTLENYGQDTLTSIPVHYVVNNGIPKNETWIGVLNPGASANFTFNTTFTSPTSNNYSLCAYTSLANDIYYFNDSTCEGLGTVVPPYDAGVTNITHPLDTTEVGTDITVKVMIRNMGQNALMSIPVSYKFINQVPVQGVWTGNLAPGDSVEYTFIQTYNSTLLIGNYSLCAFTELISDGYSLNDTTCKIIENQKPDAIGEFDLNGLWLGQNIPNPTNGITIIEYRVPSSGEASFTILNLMGELLYDTREKVSQGKHQLELDVNHFPAGVYYYLLEFKGKRLVRKMIISK
ncbi:GEVED domain-containing protein [Bacteroidota bacterium]